jgi:hypothetical protein
MRHLRLVLGFILIVLVIIAGCSTAQKSIIEKKTDLNIGDSAVLTAKNGNSISITVVNISKVSSTTGSPTGNFFNPGQTGAPITVPTSPPIERNWIIGYEIKNVGEKAINGFDVVQSWVTDWGGVKISSNKYNTGPRPIWDKTPYGYSPFYPGDDTIQYESYTFSDKSLEGKLTFYYQLGDDTASWIIKP